MERARRPDYRSRGRAGGRQEFLERVPGRQIHAPRADAAGRARRRRAANARDAGARAGLADTVFETRVTRAPGNYLLMLFRRLAQEGGPRSPTAPIPAAFDGGRRLYRSEE